MSRDEFLGNTRKVIEGYEEALAGIANKRRMLTSEIANMRREYQNAKDAHIKKLLPDLSKETLKRLRRECPTFVSTAVMKAFSDMENLHVSFLTWITGGRNRLRKQTEKNSLELLRVNLAAWLGEKSSYKSPFRDLNELYARITGFENQDRELGTKEQLARTQLLELKGQLERALGSHREPDQQSAASMRLLASDLAAHRRQLNVSTSGSTLQSNSDSISDILFYWMTGVPTSLRTAGYDLFFGSRIHHDEERRGQDRSPVPTGGEFHSGSKADINNGIKGDDIKQDADTGTKDDGSKGAIHESIHGKFS